LIRSGFRICHVERSREIFNGRPSKTRDPSTSVGMTNL
jgi:hypothetical protein